MHQCINTAGCADELVYTSIEARLFILQPEKEK
jgi:hypothetical protein